MIFTNKMIFYIFSMYLYFYAYLTPLYADEYQFITTDGPVLSIDISNSESYVGVHDIKYEKFDCNDDYFHECFTSDFMSFAIPNDLKALEFTERIWSVNGIGFSFVDVINDNDSKKKFYIIKSEVDGVYVHYVFSYEDNLIAFHLSDDLENKKLLLRNDKMCLEKLLNNELMLLID